MTKMDGASTPAALSVTSGIGRGGGRFPVVQFVRSDLIPGSRRLMCLPAAGARTTSTMSSGWAACGGMGAAVGLECTGFGLFPLELGMSVSAVYWRVVLGSKARDRQGMCGGMSVWRMDWNLYNARMSGIVG
jgi:hypothetical protein